MLQYGESGAPDVWFEPAAVWEVKAADLSISPLHQAGRGLVEADKGISIRWVGGEVGFWGGGRGVYTSGISAWQQRQWKRSCVCAHFTAS